MSEPAETACENPLPLLRSRFFYAVVADDGECMSTHPAYAPRAALIGLACAKRDEAEETDFPRVMCLERWHYGLDARVTRRERCIPEDLDMPQNV